MKNANPVCGRWGAWWLLLGAVLLAGCGPGRGEDPAPPKTVADWFAVSVGGVELELQLAVRPGEMQQGLMGRRDLTDRQGMLFVYDQAQQMSFWMRNTPTPLDIGFFTSDGVLREVYPLHPYDESPVRSFRSDLRYALEVKQGGFARLGVRLGDRLDLGAVAAAMKARGFDLRRFEGLGE